MTEEDLYGRFLSAASAAFASEGSRVLLGPGMSPAPWAAQWDLIVMTEGPGPGSLYAFTRASGAEPQELQRRLDGLAGGLATGGALSSGQMNLVAVVTFPDGTSAPALRSAARLRPSTYFAGVRPSALAVDLAAGRVVSAGRFSRPPGSELVQQALSDAVQGKEVNVVESEHRRLEAIRRTGAFYALMRGRRPVVTFSLIALNVVIFIAMYTRGGLVGGGFTDATVRDFGAMSPNLVLHGQWYRLFTAMFLHASIPHILFNMISLFAVGTLAERLYGSWRFLAIYLGAGLIGSLTSTAYGVLTNNMNELGVGASGAIFGVAGALITVRFQRSEVIPASLTARISNAMLPLVALSLFIAYVTPYVDNAAHLGGLVGGMVLSFFFPLTRRIPTQAQAA